VEISKQAKHSCHGSLATFNELTVSLGSKREQQSDLEKSHCL
jgi:hypothetical protein